MKPAATMTVFIPAYFELKTSMYARGTHEQDERSMTAMPAELLAFAFRIMEQVVARTAGVS